MSKGVIYQFISPTNKFYIGQTVNLDKRLNKYKNLHCKGQIKLYNSFNKYGFDNHIFKVIDEVDIQNLNNAERYWQDYYLSIENGLNCRYTKSNDKSGGLSEDVKRKLSISATGKKMSAEAKRKMSKSKLGKNKGFDNHNSIRIMSFNRINNKRFTMNLSDTAYYFGVDRELITNRVSGLTKNPRKLKEWSFILIND